MRLPLGSLLPPEKIATEAPGSLLDPPVQAAAASSALPANSIQVALCLEIRQGRLRVFMPPLFFVRGYVDLLAAVEQVASTQGQPIAVEGYRPPVNQGIQGFQITPDPGVLEVNIHPAGTWPELVRLHTALDQAAEDCGLATIRFARDGRPVDTGGGAHITLGAAQPQDSPLLHRPDLLQSLVTYWQHHPSLSYLFAGQFIGPTSQCPRVDEANLDSLDQLELAFALLDPQAPLPPTVVDHLLHHLLVDATGNTHRVAFCIDKLFPGDNPPLQLGLLELRGFAMPPEGQMRLLQMLLVRACVAWFWQTPYRSPFKRWGRELHDRFLLPHFIEADLKTVIHELNQAGYGFCLDWFRPFLTFRCPVYRQVHLPGLMLELRQALEPWPVLANETTSSGTSRPVDDTTERLQVMLQASSTAAAEEAGEDAPPILLCNGQPIPLHPGDQPGQWVAGVRYRARSYIWWQIEATLEKLPSHQRQRLANYLKPSEQLRFEVFDGASGRPLGGCLYQVQGSSVDQAIPTVAAAHQHLAKRVTPLANEDCQSSAAVLVTPSATALTYDLRDPR